MISVLQAQTQILARPVSLKKEKIALNSSLKRVLAENLICDRDTPPFDRATMDGIAVCWDENENNKRFTLLGELQAGDDFARKFAHCNLIDNKIKKGQAVQIMTGAALPKGCNQVIPVENLVFENKEVFLKEKPNNQFFAKKGEDAKKGDLLFGKGNWLDSRAAAVCAALGKKEIFVFSPPRVAILATGNEIVPIQKKPQNFQIRNINSYLLLSLLKKKAIPCVNLGIAQDKKDSNNKNSLRNKLKTGLECDLLLISGGVSAGKYDLVPSLLTELGCKKIFHKVSLKPGRPLWFGRHGKTAIFGIPGNPVSVHVCWTLFVEPYIHKLLGIAKEMCFPNWETRKLAQEISASFNLETYLPVKKTKDGGIIPQFFKTSGDFFSLLGSDGLIRIKAKTDFLAKDSKISYIDWDY